MADSAKDLQFRELKDMITQLNQLVRSLQETIAEAKKREAELKQERDNLKEQVALLTKKLFGASSEKRSAASQIPGQLSLADIDDTLGLFNEAEELHDPKIAAAEEELKEAPKSRKSKARQIEKLAGIPVKKVYLDLPEDKKTCQECGAPLKEIGKEFVRRELEFIPAKLNVIEYYSINYTCPSCEEAERRHNYKGKEEHPHLLHGAEKPDIHVVNCQGVVHHLLLQTQGLPDPAVFRRTGGDEADADSMANRT